MNISLKFIKYLLSFFTLNKFLNSKTKRSKIRHQLICLPKIQTINPLTYIIVYSKVSGNYFYIESIYKANTEKNLIYFSIQ